VLGLLRQPALPGKQQVEATPGEPAGRQLACAINGVKRGREGRENS